MYCYYFFFILLHTIGIHCRLLESLSLCLMLFWWLAGSSFYFAILLNLWEREKRNELYLLLVLKTSAWSCDSQGFSRETESAGKKLRDLLHWLGKSETCRLSGETVKRGRLENLEFLPRVGTAVYRENFFLFTENPVLFLRPFIWFVYAIQIIQDNLLYRKLTDCSW